MECIMDIRIRKLQRQYQAGDTAVLGQLFRVMNNTDQIRESEIKLLAMLGFHPAIEVNEGRRALPDSYLWMQLGKYISLQLVVAAHIYPFRRIFNHHQNWKNLLITQNTQPWTEEVCSEFKDAIESALLLLENWVPSNLPPIEPFKRISDMNDWSGRYGFSLHEIGQQFGELSKEYWLLWYLHHSASQLLEIRELMKRNRKYADRILIWLNEIEVFWRAEATNFEIYTVARALPVLAVHQAREELYNYLLPKAIELILL